MNDQNRGYLFRVLHRECDDHPARLLKWVGCDMFAEKAMSLHQDGTILNNEVVLALMNETRAWMQQEWRQHKKPYEIDRDKMRASIRHLEHTIAAKQSAAV